MSTFKTSHKQFKNKIEVLKHRQDTCKWGKLLTSTLADNVCKIIFESTSSCQYLIQHQTFTAIYVIVKLTNTMKSIGDEFEYKNLYQIEMMIQYQKQSWNLRTI